MCDPGIVKKKSEIQALLTEARHPPAHFRSLPLGHSLLNSQVWSTF